MAAATRTFSYDDAGDLIKKIDRDGRETQFTYDAEGRRTRRTEIATGDYIDYEWDHRGRLTAVAHRTSGGTLTKRVEYTYDVHNRRIARAVDLDGDGTPDEVTRYVHDGVGGLGWTDNVILTFDGSGALTQRFLHGPAVDQVLAVEDGSGSLRWYLSDHLGTIRDVVSHDATTDVSTIVNHLTYDSFGTITGQTNASEEPAHAFTGREWDADAGLFYYRARWYDPFVGRFIREDPIGFDAGDTNTLRYVRNNPSNAKDPTGLEESHFGSDYLYYLHPLHNNPDEYLAVKILKPAGSVMAVGGAVGAVAVGGVAGTVGAIGSLGGKVIGGVGSAIKIGTELFKKKPRIDKLIADAQKLYPKKAGKFEEHHVWPQYLGGPKNGPKVKLDGAYHQQITNEFRRLHPYGSQKPSLERVQEIMRQVYEKYPLPGGGG